MNEAVSVGLFVQSQETCSQIDGSRQQAVPECGIDGIGSQAEHADGNFGLGIEEAIAQDGPWAVSDLDQFSVSDPGGDLRDPLAIEQGVAGG